MNEPLADLQAEPLAEPLAEVKIGRPEGPKSSE